MKIKKMNHYVTTIVIALIIGILTTTIPVHASDNLSSASFHKGLIISDEFYETSAETTIDVMKGIVDPDVAADPQSNWFPDLVTVTTTRQADGSAKIVMLKHGVIFDGCTVTGTISLFKNGKLKAHRYVSETGFRTYSTRTFIIYPMGGSFDKATFNLTVSDGGESTTAVFFHTP